MPTELMCIKLAKYVALNANIQVMFNGVPTITDVSIDISTFLSRMSANVPPVADIIVHRPYKSTSKRVVGILSSNILALPLVGNETINTR